MLPDHVRHQGGSLRSLRGCGPAPQSFGAEAALVVLEHRKQLILRTPTASPRFARAISRLAAGQALTTARSFLLLRCRLAPSSVGGGLYTCPDY
jgi:hypothetical protein